MSVALSCAKGIKRISRYKIDFPWRYAETPFDGRASTGLKTWNPELHDEIMRKYQRKHGQLEGVAVQLSKYDRHYMNRGQIHPDKRRLLEIAKEETKKLLNPGFKVGGVAHVAYRPTSNTATGLPHLKKRLDILPQIHADAIALDTHIMETPEKKFVSYHSPPVIPQVKSVVGLKAKTRGIWNYSAVINTIENKYGYPLYKALLVHKHSSQIPLMHGPSAFSDARGFLRSLDIGEGICSKDYVAGDTQIPPWLIRDAKEILESFCDFSTFAYMPVTPEQAEKNKRSWDYTWWYFINTPIVFNDVLYRKSGGIPSGSLYTLLAWCALNTMVNIYLALDVENRLLSYSDLRVCGDDSLTKVLPTSTLSMFCKSALGIGLVFHPEKSALAVYPNHLDVETLSTNFSDPNIVRRDELKLFAKMLHPARFIRNREESVARVMMLSLSVFNTMPRIYEFAKWYFLSKPCWLKRPIFIDVNLSKYFYYVLGMGHFLRGLQCVGDLLPAFNDSVRNSLCTISA